MDGLASVCEAAWEKDSWSILTGGKGRWREKPRDQEDRQEQKGAETGVNQIRGYRRI